MKCTIAKINGTTIFSIYMMEKEGQRVDVGSSRFYPSTYRCAVVEARKGKVTVNHNWSTTTVLPSNLKDVPAFIAEHEEVAQIAADAAECLKSQMLELANEAIANETEIEILLTEKGDEWRVTAKLAECWLEWGLGKCWYSIPEYNPPRWAVKLRGMWDHAWA